MTDPPRRLAVTGASGNVGTAVLRHLAASAPDVELVGVCRRAPRPGDPVYDRVRWVRVDVAAPDAPDALARAFAGADTVLHLAWQLQPSWDLAALQRTNVEGSDRVFEAAHRAGVAHLVHASSVGAYSPGPKDRPVEESWPTDGVASSSYSRHKAAAERLLDRLERAPAAPAVARVRPGLIFQRDSGSEIARYFLGPLVPRALVGARRFPVLPVPDAAVFQAVHAADVADALWRVVSRRATGPFNLAAAPVLTPERLAEVFHARRVRLPEAAVRRAAELTWRVHLQPTEPGWVDLAFAVPVMSTERARAELEWVPRYDARAALAEMLDGMRAGAGTASAPLARRSLLPRRHRGTAATYARR
jgi:nucleoside-diphosphate-sugar epimerase